jgi:hypothetical protein
MLASLRRLRAMDGLTWRRLDGWSWAIFFV